MGMNNVTMEMGIQILPAFLLMEAVVLIVICPALY
jgi:hypothetical protein